MEYIPVILPSDKRTEKQGIGKFLIAGESASFTYKTFKIHNDLGGRIYIRGRLTSCTPKLVVEIRHSDYTNAWTVTRLLADNVKINEQDPWLKLADFWQEMSVGHQNVDQMFYMLHCCSGSQPTWRGARLSGIFNLHCESHYRLWPSSMGKLRWDIPNIGSSYSEN